MVGVKQDIDLTLYVLNFSSCKARTYLFYIVNIVAADDLATQGARASATMIFTILNRISVRRLKFNNDVEGSVSNCNYEYACVSVDGTLIKFMLFQTLCPKLNKCNTTHKLKRLFCVTNYEILNQNTIQWYQKLITRWMSAWLVLCSLFGIFSVACI